MVRSDEFDSRRHLCSQTGRSASATRDCGADSDCVARELGMATLVEAHNENEFGVAEQLGTDLIGVNNRDLHSFVTDIAVTERLLDGYRGKAVIVAESGIDSAADIRRLDTAGARAFLIGECLLRGGAPRAELIELMNALDDTIKQ